MRKVMISKFSAVSMTSVLAFLLILVMAGCGREQAPATLPRCCQRHPRERRHRRARRIFNHRDIQQSHESHFDKYLLVHQSSGPAGAPVTGTVTYSGTTATFTPATLAGRQFDVHRHDKHQRYGRYWHGHSQIILCGVSRLELFPR